LSTGTGGKYLTVEKHCDTENDRGHEMLGGWLSVTVTVIEQVDELPRGLVDVNVKLLVPTGYTLLSTVGTGPVTGHGWLQYVAVG